LIQLKIKNSHQKNIPKFILTLTVRGRKLPLLSQSLSQLPGISRLFREFSSWRERPVERLFNIVSHYRPTVQSLFLAGSLFVAPIMPHYVNIAWEDYFLVMSFCLLRRRSSLFFGFYLMIIANYKSQQNNVLHVRGDKKHDKK